MLTRHRPENVPYRHPQLKRQNTCHTCQSLNGIKQGMINIESLSNERGKNEVKIVTMYVSIWLNDVGGHQTSV